MKEKQIKIIICVVIGLGVLLSGGIFIKNKREQRRREEAQKEIDTLKRVIESSQIPDSTLDNPWSLGGVKPQ